MLRCSMRGEDAGCCNKSRKEATALCVRARLLSRRPKWAADQVIARLKVGGREHRVDIVQGHVKVAEAADDLGGRDLIRRVPAIAGLRINLRRFEQAALVVVTQRLDAEVRSAGKVTDCKQKTAYRDYVVSPWGRVKRLDTPS